MKIADEKRLAREKGEQREEHLSTMPTLPQDISKESPELSEPDPFFPFTSSVVRDTNHDGNTDFWMFANKEKTIRTEVDLNYDSKVDMWGIFDENGRLIMGKKDTNYDGKVDVVNYYKGGELEKVGVDANFDGVLDWWQYYEQGIAVKSVQDRSFKKK